MDATGTTGISQQRATLIIPQLVQIQWEGVDSRRAGRVGLASTNLSIDYCYSSRSCEHLVLLFVLRCKCCMIVRFFVWEFPNYKEILLKTLKAFGGSADPNARSVRMLSDTFSV